MKRAGIIVMISILAIMAGATLSPAQDGGRGDAGERKLPGAVDSGSNGQPVPAQVDADAVAELERLRELYETDEGAEKEVADGCLRLLPTFEGGEDYDHLVDCLFLLGDANYYLGEWAAAQRYMQRAFDLGMRYFPDEMSGYPLKVIGECQFELGEQETALATFRQRVQMVRKQENSTDLAGALFDVGAMLVNLGREDEALTVLAEALSANNDRAGELSEAGSGAGDEERAANVIDHAEIVYHLAIANFHLERYEDARKYLEQAYAFFTSIQDTGQYDVADRLVFVLDDLVLVNEQLGDSITADRYQRERDQLNQ